MPPGQTDDGARSARALRQRLPNLPILLLSQHIETRHSLELVCQGGFGYLLKDRVLDVDDFLDAMDRVATGGSALDPDVVAQLVGRRPSDPLTSLTPREREVLTMMARGRTNVGIAKRLHLSERTVETHVTSILTTRPLARWRRRPPPRPSRVVLPRSPHLRPASGGAVATRNRGVTG